MCSHKTPENVLPCFLVLVLILILIHWGFRRTKEIMIKIKIRNLHPIHQGTWFWSCRAAAFALLVSCATSSFPADLSALQAHKDRALTEFFRRTSGWVAGDGATSVPLSDGRVLWLFGDSHINDYEAATGTMACLFQVRNAAMVQSRDDREGPRTLLDEKARDKSLFKHPVDRSLWFWPSAGFQNGDTIWIYLTALQKTGAGGPWGFKAVGNYWAKLAFPSLKVTGYVALPPTEGIGFGCGSVTDNSNGCTYAFGNRRDGTASDVYVARFSARKPEGDWNFWDGSNWTSNARQAVAITRGASTSVSVCRIENRFVLISSEFSVACDQGKEIYLSTSGSTTGPFGPWRKVYTIDDTWRGHFPNFYLPVAHPELSSAVAGLVVTYCINGYEPCANFCANGRANPDHYRPRAIRVPFELIERR